MIASTLIALLVSTSFATRLQVDGHINTSSRFQRQATGMSEAEGLQASLPQLQDGGTNLAVEYLWANREGDPRATVYGILQRLLEEEEENDELQLALSPESAQTIIEDGNVAMLIGLEGAHGLGVNQWRSTLFDLRRRGVAVISLTWSFSNQFAGSFGDGGGGLTEEGRLLIGYARDIGMMIDVSNGSHQTIMQTCRDSPVPVVASYSNARSIHDHPRNLTDDEIRCIAATGGVIGLTLHQTFLGGDGDMDQLIQHANHIADLVGRQHVALGSGFDGMINPATGLESADKMQALWRKFRASGWLSEEVDGVRGENYFRAWRGVHEWPRGQ
jgi:membrane dipeptidase